MSAFSSFFAMAAPAGQPSEQSPISFFVMMILFFGIMYVMMIRPQQRKEKERRAMLDQLKKGDKVLFAGGLMGEVAEIGSKTAKIKVADNLRLDVARGAITAVIQDGEEIGDIAQG
jgi:preprotein translocase subunit YajC